MSEGYGQHFPRKHFSTPFWLQFSTRNPKRISPLESAAREVTNDRSISLLGLNRISEVLSWSEFGLGLAGVTARIFRENYPMLKFGLKWNPAAGGRLCCQSIEAVSKGLAEYKSILAAAWLPIFRNPGSRKYSAVVETLF